MILNNYSIKKNFFEKAPKQFHVSRSEIHVWKLCLSTINKDKSLLATLSEEESKRLKSFKLEKDRFRYIITHNMKRWVIAKYLNQLPEKLTFIQNKQGKPEISFQQNWLNLKFNISHSHQIILIALTSVDPVGVDVEYYTRNISVNKLCKIIFSPLEKENFSKIINKKERNKSFFRCWTRKEAYLKAKGVGLMGFSNNISVDMSDEPFDNWLETFDKRENISWKLFTLNIDKSYIACIVSTHYPKSLVGYTADFNEILSNI